MHGSQLSVGAGDELLCQLLSCATVFARFYFPFLPWSFNTGTEPGCTEAVWWTGKRKEFRRSLKSHQTRASGLGPREARDGDDPT